MFGASPRVTDITGVDQSCEDVGICAGTLEDNGNCKWVRKLKVTCDEQNGKVFITVQSNGLPNHCYEQKNGGAPSTWIDIDFKVRWLPPAVSTTEADPRTQEEVDALICNDQTAADSNIPSDSEYTKIGSTDLD